MTKWMMIFALAIVAAASMNACNSDGAEPDVRCERVDIEGEEYCLYSQPITETGYDCPQDLANPIEFEGSTVCSRQDEIPEAHRDPVRDELERLGDDGDQGPNNPPNNSSDLPDGIWQGDTATQGIEVLCNNPAQYDGTTIEISGEMIDSTVMAPAIECEEVDAGSDADSDEEGRACCRQELRPFVIPCANQDLQTTMEGILLVPGPGISDDIGCVGDNCSHDCRPAPPEQIESFEGTFRDETASFIWGDINAADWAFVIEVSSFNLEE